TGRVARGGFGRYTPAADGEAYAGTGAGLAGERADGAPDGALDGAPDELVARILTRNHDAGDERAAPAAVARPTNRPGRAWPRSAGCGEGLCRVPQAASKAVACGRPW